ncbi:MAG: ATP-binding cassette domain-containing protein [Desulfovibrionaceae bacterium]|nr:ATP-binding cassette domain-containing protein [Desulfovibrionaceae bacterium]
MSLAVAACALTVERVKNGASFTLIVPRLEVHFQETLAVVGSSGCGKSTLLDMLALILRPQEATNFCLYPQGQAEDILTCSQKRLAQLRGQYIGYVLQAGGLFSFLSVRDNIMLPGRLLGLPEQQLEQQLLWLVQNLGIAEQLEKKPQHLSGGQRQRVAIARALIHKPRLVLADEPTAAVDQASAADICAVFKSMVQDVGAALVIVSHDQPLMHRIADHIVTFRLEKRGQNAVHSCLVAGGEV